MRQIGNLPDEVLARKFSDYLYVKGIENEVDPSSDGSWTVWVLSDDKLADAAAKLEIYRNSPNLPEYDEDASQAESRRKLKEEENEKFRKKVYDRDRIFSWQTQFGLLTVTMMAISIVLYVLWLFGHSATIVQIFSIEAYSDDIDPVGRLSEILRGEVWRIITPIFIHFGLLHLVFNMFWIKDLGTAIEKRYGALVLGVLVLVIASTSNLAQYLARGPAFGGMSGVVYGLFGYIWMQSRFNPASGFHLDTQTVTLMIVWFVLCLTGMVGPIANTAHGVGLLAGMAIGYVSAHINSRR